MAQCVKCNAHFPTSQGKCPKCGAWPLGSWRGAHIRKKGEASVRAAASYRAEAGQVPQQDALRTDAVVAQRPPPGILSEALASFDRTGTGADSQGRPDYGLADWRGRSGRLESLQALRTVQIESQSRYGELPRPSVKYL